MNTRFLQVIVLIAIIFFASKNIAYSQSSSQESYNPKPASASLYNLGLKSYENGDLNSAVTYFKRAIDLDSDFVDAYFNLGAIYKKLRKYPQAIHALQKAIELAPDDYEATYELASCHLAMKNYAYASKYFARIPETFPKYNEAKASLDKINTFLARSGGQPVISGNPKAPENQAKLLVNALTNEQKNISKTSLPNTGQTTSPQSQAKLLVNTLTKPEEDILENNNLNIVSHGFSGPTGIAKDSKGNIYIANFSSDSIERVLTDGSKEIFVDKVGIQGPVGLAFDDEDNLYVANYRGGSIVKISQDKSVSIVIGDLNKPYYLFFDKDSGKLLITEQGKNSLIEVDTSTTVPHPITKN